MDEISTSIWTAVASGMTAGISDIGKKMVGDAYGALKVAFQKKFGVDSPVAEAVEKLEKDPESTTHLQTLQKEIETAKATDDFELIELARVLLATLNEGRATVKKYEIHAKNIGGVTQSGDIHINNMG